MANQYTLPGGFSRVPGALGLGASLCLAGLVLSGCAKPPPRTYTDFMEDRIAREGTLARCNQLSEEAEGGIECANARRAAMAIALREEREKRETLERESERKLAALRAQLEERERAAREAAAAAEAAKLAAYEAQWRDTPPGSGPNPAADSAATPDALPAAASEDFGAASPAGRLESDAASAVPAPGVAGPAEPEATAEAAAVPRPFRPSTE